MKLLVTDECQRLARWLRLMGYDTLIMPAQPLSALYQTAHNEDRIVLTRNQRVRPGTLARVMLMRHTNIVDQLRQVERDLGEPDSRARFSRCDQCNAVVEAVTPEDVRGQVPPYVYQTQRTFRRCPACGKVYWSATHCDQIASILRRVHGAAGTVGGGAHDA